MTLLLAAAVLVFVVIGSTGVRIVPAGHRGVVTRFGRPVRCRPSGLLVSVPGVERVEMVSLQPESIDSLGVPVLTRDAVEVRLLVDVVWQVTEPRSAVNAWPDARSATSAAVERALRRLIGNVDLTDLLRERESVLSRLPVATQPLLSPLGVELVDVDLLDVEVRVGPQLLRLIA